MMARFFFLNNTANVSRELSVAPAVLHHPCKVMIEN
jgi:hypothetical protein